MVYTFVLLRVFVPQWPNPVFQQPADLLTKQCRRDTPAWKRRATQAGREKIKAVESEGRH